MGRTKTEPKKPAFKSIGDVATAVGQLLPSPVKGTTGSKSDHGGRRPVPVIHSGSGMTPSLRPGTSSAEGGIQPQPQPQQPPAPSSTAQPAPTQPAQVGNASFPFHPMMPGSVVPNPTPSMSSEFLQQVTAPPLNQPQVPVPVQAQNANTAIQNSLTDQRNDGTQNIVDRMNAVAGIGQGTPQQQMQGVLNAGGTGADARNMGVIGTVSGGQGVPSANSGPLFDSTGTIGGGSANVIMQGITKPDGSPVTQQEYIAARNQNYMKDRVDQSRVRRDRRMMLAAAQVAARQGDTQTMADLASQAANMQDAPDFRDRLSGAAAERERRAAYMNNPNLARVDAARIEAQGKRDAIKTATKASTEARVANQKFELAKMTVENAMKIASNKAESKAMMDRLKQEGLDKVKLAKVNSLLEEMRATSDEEERQKITEQLRMISTKGPSATAGEVSKGFEAANKPAPSSGGGVPEDQAQPAVVDTNRVPLDSNGQPVNSPIGSPQNPIRVKSKEEANKILKSWTGDFRPKFTIVK